MQPVTFVFLEEPKGDIFEVIQLVVEVPHLVVDILFHYFVVQLTYYPLCFLTHLLYLLLHDREHLLLVDLQSLHDVPVHRVDDTVDCLEVGLDLLLVLFKSRLVGKGVLEEGKEGAAHGAFEEGGEPGGGVSTGAG